jgi:hypothetical protein
MFWQLLLISTILFSAALPQARQPQRAVLDPGSAILYAFQTHAIVELGEGNLIRIRRGEKSPSLCADDTYMKMRLSRMALIDPPTPFRPVQSPAKRLRQYCDNVMQRKQPDKE